MKLQKLFYNLTGCSDSRVLKVYITISRSNKFNLQKKRRFIIKDRFMLLFGSLVMPLLVRFRKNNSNLILMVEPSNSDYHIKIYDYFLKRRINNKITPYHWKNGIIIESPSAFVMFFKYWLSMLKIAFQFLFVTSNLPFYELFKFQITLLNVKLLKPREIYIFNYHSVVSNLLVVSLKSFSNVYYYPSNSNLVPTMRYGYFYNTTIILSSKMQLVQFNYLCNIGWIKIINAKVEIAESLFIMHHNDFPREIKYDLGFFSSGEWARRNGLFRGDNLAEIGKNISNSNELAKLSESILEFLVPFALKNKLKLKIYLHPYERELITHYKIFPPFYKYIDNTNIFNSDLSSNSISNLFEIQLSIITISSILFDRDAYDLDSLFFVNENINGMLTDVFYQKKYFPNSSNHFSNLEELENGLINYFNIRST